MNPNIENLKVLIVEPNSNMRSLIKDILRNSFFMRDIQEASTMESAFKAINASPPDILFTEKVMDPINGIDFTRFLRTSPKSPKPEMSIIMLTGETDVETLTLARDAGVTEFMAKPFTAQAIMARLNAVIKRPRPFIQVKNYSGPDRRRRVVAPEETGERRNSISQ
jgi:two-component system, chemotaxis family, chemotaxis protein CheY